jgi:hypothetical protein
MHSASRLSSRRFTGFSLALATILAGGAAAGLALGSAAPAGAATRGPSASPAASLSIAGELDGVAATSAGNAWAVGDTSGGRSLILHWNGTSWKRVPGPSTTGAVYLSSVAATSGRNAWAVGYVPTSSYGPAGLILHWNGTAWKRVPTQTPTYGKYGYALFGVATSAVTAWAVGCTDGCPVGGTPLIERWNGTSWKQAAAPATGEVAATAHWNGRAWTLGKGILDAGLTGIATTSATGAWAVGGTTSGRTLILHWNGKTWS